MLYVENFRRVLLQERYTTDLRLSKVIRAILNHRLYLFGATFASNLLSRLRPVRNLRGVELIVCILNKRPFLAWKQDLLQLFVSWLWWFLPSNYQLRLTSLNHFSWSLLLENISLPRWVVLQHCGLRDMLVLALFWIYTDLFSGGGRYCVHIFVLLKYLLLSKLLWEASLRL